MAVNFKPKQLLLSEPDLGVKGIAILDIFKFDYSKSI